MAQFKIFNGTDWVDPCDCNVHLNTASGWVKLDPRNCPTHYFNGTDWCEIVCSKLAVDSTTEINIWFDNSGSMNSTLAPLQEMQNTLLKNCLLPIYNNDNALYEEKVKVLNMSNTPEWNYNERFIRCISTERNFQRAPDTTTGLVINLTFADESNDYGYGGSGTFDPNTRTAGYDNDINMAKTSLANASNSNYTIKGFAFRVSTSDNLYQGFRELTQATFVNIGAYTPTYSLSEEYNQNLFKFDLDVLPGSTASYYKDLVVQGLQDLDISVPFCP